MKSRPEHARNSPGHGGASPLVAGFGASLVFLLLCLGAAAGESLGHYAGVDLRTLVGPAADGPARKTLNVLFAVFTAVSVVCCFAWCGRGGRRGPAMAVVLLVLAQNTALLLVLKPLAEAREVRQGTRIPNFERLHLVERTCAEFPAGCTREAARQSGATAPGPFHDWMAGFYDQSRSALAAEWGVEDEDTLKTLFYMNAVSRLWAFGNRIHVKRPGCALSNEANGWQPPPAPDLDAHLSSEIGCCNDFAWFVKLLLDREGIRNRLTMVPGHIFNEVHLAGRWCVVDASANLFVEAGWEEICSSAPKEPLTVRMFPLQSLADESSLQYRPLAGRFRILMLLWMANPPASVSAAEHPELPAYLK